MLEYSLSVPGVLCAESGLAVTWFLLRLILKFDGVQ